MVESGIKVGVGVCFKVKVRIMIIGKLRDKCAPFVTVTKIKTPVRCSRKSL
jgi:hypothetical protein